MVSKNIGEVETERFQLIVIECGRCQYHMGVDGSYIDQVGEINVVCPSCHNEIDTDECVDDHYRVIAD